MQNKKQIILSIIAIVTLAILVIGASFAYFAAQGNTSAQTSATVKTYTVDVFSFETGDPISFSLNQENFASGKGNQTGSTFAKAILTANNKTNTATDHYYMYLNISENTFTYTQNENTPEILLTITDGTNPVTNITSLSYKTVTDGKGNSISGYDITNKTGLIELFSNREITTTSTKTENWNITVTFVNYNADQSKNAGNTFSGKMLIQKEEYKLPTLAEYVISQYTGTQGENSLYYHNSNLTNGAGDNSYRYAGANPNNYVCFGSSESICPDANLFRIIGVFENQVKVIRVKSESSQMWNKSVSNTWSTSGLNTYLNGTYLTSLGNLSDKIAITTWKVGGNIHENIVKVTPSVAFQNEIIGTAESATFNAKIGLMYVTDYYYAASPSAWTLVGYNESDATKDYRAATSVNWLYLRNHEWTITRVSDNSQTVFLVGAEGNTFSYLAFDLECEVRPTFSLEPSVTYVSGSGTMDNPIRIS